VKFFKDDEELVAAPIEPGEALTLAPQANANQRALASIYNRLGGLLALLAGRTGVEVAAVLAVWFIESGRRPFVQKRAVVRLEVHQLFDLWGKRSRAQFDAHFRFGGHNNQPGRPWENQDFRTQDTGGFSAVHHNQSSEYAALTLAQIIAGDEIAFRCTSIGGCQLMMNAFQTLGFETATQMHEAFQASEATQVLTFFDFCQTKSAPKVGDLLNYLKTRDWQSFAKYYNGSGQVPVYSARLHSAFDTASVLVAGRKAA
jgi:hypothetical protein